MSDDRLIVHLDMDSFYVSVERFFDPSLNGKAVAVGGAADGRGVVSSASYEARKFGVRSAMPMAKALQLCPQLIVVHGVYSRYATFSEKVEEALLEFTPLVEMASQDEAYCDLTGTSLLWGTPLATGHRMRTRVAENTQLPCTIGISTNRLVSKVASALAKPRGLLYVPPGSEARFLAPLPVRRLPGVGPKSEERLKSLSITRIGHLAALTDDLAERHFGEHGLDMVRRARGISDSPIVMDHEAKSISCEETFDHDTTDVEFLDRVLSTLCERVASRVRKEPRRAATVSVKYRYGDFETHTAARTLEMPADDEGDFFAVAKELLHGKRIPGRALRLIGVAATNFIRGEVQLDLLAATGEDRKEKLHAAIDAVRNKHGYKYMRRASSSQSEGEMNDERWG